MKVYLAAAFHRKEEIRTVALRLRLIGVGVTSQWLEEGPCPTEQPAKDKFLRETAFQDLADIRDADVFVRFTDFTSEELSLMQKRKNEGYLVSVAPSLITGARHFECGYALATGKPILVVGGA